MIQPRRPSCANGTSRAKRVGEWGTWGGRVKRTDGIYVSLPPEQIWPEMKRLFLHLWISPPSSHKLNCVRHFVSHLFDYFHFTVCINFKLSYDRAQHQRPQYFSQTRLKRTKTSKREKWLQILKDEGFLTFSPPNLWSITPPQAILCHYCAIVLCHLFPWHPTQSVQRCYSDNTPFCPPLCSVLL